MHWPKDIFDKLPSHSTFHKDYHSTEGKTTNDWRFGNIGVDWIDMELDDSKVPSESVLSRSQRMCVVF